MTKCLARRRIFGRMQRQSSAVRKEIPARLQSAHGDACMGACVVRRWVNHRKDRSTNTADGRPQSCLNLQKSELIVFHLHTERISNEFNGPKHNFMSLLNRNLLREDNLWVQKEVRRCAHSCCENKLGLYCSSFEVVKLRRVEFTWPLLLHDTALRVTCTVSFFFNCT